MTHFLISIFTSEIPPRKERQVTSRESSEIALCAKFLTRRSVLEGIHGAIWIGAGAQTEVSKKKVEERKRGGRKRKDGKCLVLVRSETFNPTDSRDATLEVLHSLARRLAFRREARALHFTSVPERARMHPDAPRCDLLVARSRGIYERVSGDECGETPVDFTE